MANIKTFTTEVEIRFNDIDAMGHVNNAVIFTYFEEGRKSLFYSALNKTAPGGFSFIVAHLECDYIRPVRLEDRLLLKMGVPTIGNKSFSLSYELMDAANTDRMFAQGLSVQVCYDYDHQQSIRIPDDLRQALFVYFNPA
jgi:acyl-CoA thioester hydrolase